MSGRRAGELCLAPKTKDLQFVILILLLIFFRNVNSIKEHPDEEGQEPEME